MTRTQNRTTTPYTGKKGTQRTSQRTPTPHCVLLYHESAVLALSHPTLSPPWRVQPTAIAKCEISSPATKRSSSPSTRTWIMTKKIERRFSTLDTQAASPRNTSFRRAQIESIASKEIDNALAPPCRLQPELFEGQRGANPLACCLVSDASEPCPLLRRRCLCRLRPRRLKHCALSSSLPPTRLCLL